MRSLKTSQEAADDQAVKTSCLLLLPLLPAAVTVDLYRSMMCVL
jgi:hypothetical protein